MSTEVKEAEPATNGHVDTPVAIAELKVDSGPVRTRRPFFRSGWAVTAITVVIALTIAGVVGTNFLTRQYTPDGAVRQYLAALQAGDAPAAWGELQVSAPTTPTSASLVD